MTTTSISMNEESFYHTSFTYQNLETSPNTYYQVPSLSDNSNDVYLNESDMQPYLNIEVQPCDKFRFRYSSETGSHGKVRGPEKNRSKTNFPTVKLYNRDNSRGKIEVKASLYTFEKESRPHILELVGKNCREGGCWETLSDNDTAIFRFLEIENKRKEEAINILMERKIKHVGRRQNKEKMKEEAQEEFKSLNMNCTRLCFEAFQNGNPITGKVFSYPIKNLKSTSSDLKISRISSCSGSCKGGDEIILLCDKINKDDIEIHFYEKGEDDAVLWTAEGKFNPKVDVHHQVAIVFKTPEYKHNYAGSVYMELYRRSDKQSSEPRMFTYVPDEIESLRDSKKRRLNSYESQPSTSSGYDSSTPISPIADFSIYSGIPLQFENILESTESCDGLQLPEMVDADKLLELNGFTGDVISQLIADAPEPLYLCPKEKFPEATGSTEFNFQDYSTFPTESMLQEAFGGTESNFEEISTLPPEPTLPEEVTGSKELKDHDYSMQPPKITYMSHADFWAHVEHTSSSTSFSLTNMIRDGFDYVKNIFPSTTASGEEQIIDEMPCSGGLGIGSLAIYGLKSGMEKLISLDKPSHNTKSPKAISKSGQKEAASYDSFKTADDKIYAQSALCFDMTTLSIDDDEKKAVKQNVSMESPLTVEVQSATSTIYEGSKNEVGIYTKFEHFKESISCILKNRDKAVYLQYISKLLSVSDEDGNTFLHLAVREQSENANLIAKIIEMRPDFVNKQNNFKETPLHLATKMNEHKIVLLLLLKGGNPSIVNANGSNCYHITSRFKFTNAMKMLLLPSLKYGKDIPSIDDINYEGFAPIHLAVLNNAKECLNLLIQAGADVNIKDRKSGSAPLNLALKHQPSLVQDLLCHPHIDLLNQDFHGDTFIHVLCNMKGGIPVPRFKHSEDLVDWARKALALPSIDTCEDSSEGSDTDFSDEESENEEEATASAREYSILPEQIMNHEQLIIYDVDQNSLNEECEEQLRIYLDASSGWRKLGLSIGFSEKTLDGLATLSKNSSPSKVILRKIKVLYKNCDRQTLVNILNEADLKEAAKILK
ncbi:hypothetical protein JTE90_024835 [Oedothorax gibbosus]|uniref:Relish n=1 Tax=Oedothorax gibbosus TaxID=931172 RepID=A0AAV6U4F6_9ARAC|nr:hypothetical protein JTE90_024835 [Oedothorax gibbosus]